MFSDLVLADESQPLFDNAADSDMKMDGGTAGTFLWRPIDDDNWLFSFKICTPRLTFCIIIHYIKR